VLEGFAVSLVVDVAWSDMDAFAHVNNAVYFRWFESARIAYFHALGFSDRRQTADIGPILASTHCRFRIPVTFPDRMHVGARVTEVSVDRFTMAYRAFSERHNAVAAEGGGIIVAYDYASGTKALLPEQVRLRIREIDGV
jgi:acyl-CoA thioester hydrolase